MYVQVSVSSLGVSQRSDDAHENANGVSDHPEVVQREPNTHRQRPSVHIVLLLQRTGETCHIGLKLVLAGSLFKQIYIQQLWSDDLIVFYLFIFILPVCRQVYTLFLKCVLLSRPDSFVPSWLYNMFFYFLFRSELLFLLFTSHPSTRLFHLFKSTIFTVHFHCCSLCCLSPFEFWWHVSLTHVAVVCFIQSEAPSVCSPPLVCADYS